MTMRKLKMIAVYAVIIFAGIVASYAYVKENTGNTKSEVSAQTEQVRGPHLIVSPAEHDFGIVRQSGGVVSTTFELVNDGSEDVVITSTPASCSCTSASVDKNTLAPGERGNLTVRFDPNYHYEDEGKFFRTVAIRSNASGDAPEVKIWVEVLYDLGKDKLKFNKKN